MTVQNLCMVDLKECYVYQQYFSKYTMGSSASNQNRVASAGLSRDGHEHFTLQSNDNRPHSCSPAHSKSEQTEVHSQEKKRAPSKTEVISLSSQNFVEKTTSSTSPPSTDDHQKKLRELEKQLAKSESQKLDLLEQLNGLKQKNLLKRPASVLPPLEEHNPPPLKETSFAKDQYIVKLEKDLQAAQKELACVRQKLKKRIRVLTNQLHEVRQEGSINQMELQAEISQQKETIEKLKGSGSKEGFSSEGTEASGQSKIIVELSNQLSEQAEQITSLQAELDMKKQKIQELEASQTHFPEIAGDSSVSTDRLPSGRGKRSHKNDVDNSTTNRFPKLGSELPERHKQAVPTAFPSHKIAPVLERQSTALSDSDSDWELDTVPSKIQSAPAGARIKSAVSVSSSVANKDGTIFDFQGNDDSILKSIASSKSQEEDDISTSNRRTKSYKKSALKSHLERKKHVNQTNALIGPSLAFASKSKEPPSDTSCEPTPRCADRSHLPGFAGLHVVNSVSH
ncbi:hypothetical protein EGW08_012678 [Elysia chlorotica]|uniref:Uncharacterized protein n=1 Tax=Elysia chlorotica TaxID=188477 RepID=A0A3S1BBG4_ELYCH|nr:hypothetical protein EGW08_012678 [Elysia chlorotica]